MEEFDPTLPFLSGVSHYQLIGGLACQHPVSYRQIPVTIKQTRSDSQALSQTHVMGLSKALRLKPSKPLVRKQHLREAAAEKVHQKLWESLSNARLPGAKSAMSDTKPFNIKGPHSAVSWPVTVRKKHRTVPPITTVLAAFAC